MTSIVETCWGERKIDDKQYWHLTPNSGMAATLFKHNVHVGNGALLSVSAGIAAEPNIHNAQTPYSMAKIDDKKEKIFEEIRQSEFPACPPRLKSLYVFDDLNLAESALEEWFTNENRLIHECRVITGAVIHKADTFWLNTLENQWESNSRNYWNGTMSDEPFPEVLVNGALYFPNWGKWTNA